MWKDPESSQISHIKLTTLSHKAWKAEFTVVNYAYLLRKLKQFEICQNVSVGHGEKLCLILNIGEYQVILQTSEIRNKLLLSRTVSYVDQTLKQATVMCTTNLKKVDGFLKDEECSIRPAASENEENVGKVYTILTSDLCMTVEQISE